MARILVVDDEADIRDVIWMKLDQRYHQQYGGIHEVEMAGDAAEALEMWEKNSPYDLLITDFAMGVGLNGVALARVLVHNALSEQRRELPVILMSAYNIPQWHGYFCRKPFSLAALANLVNRLLGGRSATPPRTSTPPPNPAAPVA